MSLPIAVGEEGTVARWVVNHEVVLEGFVRIRWTLLFGPVDVLAIRCHLGFQEVEVGDGVSLPIMLS